MGRPSSSRFVAVMALSVAAAATACKKDDAGAGQVVDDNDDPALLAEDGTDSATAETDSEVVSLSLVASATSDASGTPANLGDGAKAIYLPKGCLVVTANEAAHATTYTFNGCRGPNGIGKLTGTIDAQYAVTAGKLVLDLKGTDLALNRAKSDYEAHAEVTASGAMRTMVWTASLTGTTARGREFARSDAKTLRWSVGERCFAVEGRSEGHVKGRYVKTEIADFRRCAGACPEAGGRITISNEKEKVKVEIVYDGTSTAVYTTPKGTFSFDLACLG